MTDWIGRYVDDVARRLPESERQEVRRELTANIQDMLPEDAGEDEIKAVLEEMGDPAVLAGRYRQRPNYLISPAVYDDYVRVLKLVVPLVGGIMLAVGVLLGIFNVLDGDSVGRAISSGLSLGLSAVFQALIWVTAGFAVADRVGVKQIQPPKEWHVEDLPEYVEDPKGKISLGDGISDLVMTAIFTALGLLLCTGQIPFVLVLRNLNIQIYSIFSESFLATCIPLLAICGVLGIIRGIAKTISRRWTPLVCITVILADIVSVIGVLILATRTDMFSAEFTAFLHSINWGSVDLLSFVGTSAGNPIFVVIAVVVIVCAVAESVTAVRKTARAAGK